MIGPKVSLSSDMPSCQAEREAGTSMKYFTSAGSSMWAAQLAMKKMILAVTCCCLNLEIYSHMGSM